MRFLVDQCLSPKLAKLLIAAGHDAVHVRERGLSTATDVDVLSFAQTERRVLVTADTDFPSILTVGARQAPSCILFRGEFHPSADEQSRLLLAAIAAAGPHLERGALVVITSAKVRIRDLPVTPD